MQTCLLVWLLMLFCSLQRRRENDMKIVKFQLNFPKRPSANDVWGPAEFTEKVIPTSGCLMSLQLLGEVNLITSNMMVPVLLCFQESIY